VSDKNIETTKNGANKKKNLIAVEKIRAIGILKKASYYTSAMDLALAFIKLAPL